MLAISDYAISEKMSLKILGHASLDIGQRLQYPLKIYLGRVAQVLLS